MSNPINPTHPNRPSPHLPQEGQTAPSIQPGTENRAEEVPAFDPNYPNYPNETQAERENRRKASGKVSVNETEAQRNARLERELAERRAAGR